MSLRTQISQEFSQTHGSYDDQILTFKNTYSNPFPPNWMTMEVTSFGTLSLLLKYAIGGRTKRNIASYYGVADTILESYYRNSRMKIIT